jgi:hypothetical protein
VNWRPWLEDRALRQIQGLPSEAFDMLVRTLTRICDDPYDPVFSSPVPPGLAGCDHREWVGEIAASIVAVGSQLGMLDDEIFAGVHLGGGAGRVLRRRGGRHPVLPAAARRGPR